MQLPCFNTTPTIEAPVNHEEQETILLDYLVCLIQGYQKQSETFRMISRDRNLSPRNRQILANCIKNINQDKKY
jgi:hypothetical protein